MPYDPNFQPVTYGLTDAAPPPPVPGLGTAVLHHAVGSIVPTGAGFAGAEAGAALGSFIGPEGTLAGGLIGLGLGAAGALGAGSLASAGQEAFLKSNPQVADALGQSDDQRQAEEEAHPVGSFLGGLAPQALLLRPSFDILKGGAKTAGAVLGMATGGALQGGIEAAQEYGDDGKIDPTKVALSAGAGALLSKPYGIGKMIGGALGRAHASAGGDGGLAEGVNDPSTSGGTVLALPDLRGQSGDTLYVDSQGRAGPSTGHAGPLLLPAPDEVGVGSKRAATPPDPADLPPPLALTYQPADDTSPAPQAAPALYADADGNVGPTPGHTPILALPNPSPPEEPVGVGSKRAPPPGPPLPLPNYVNDPDAGRPPGPSLYGTQDGQVAPQPTQDLGFTGKEILDRLAQANLKADGTPVAPSPFARKLSIELANYLQKGDIDAAQALVDRHVGTVSADEYDGPKAHQNTVLAAIDELGAFRKQYGEILPEADKPAEAGPGPVTPTPADASRDIPTPADATTPAPDAMEAANAAAEFSRQKTQGMHDQETAAHRGQLLSNVLADPNVQNPTKKFLAELVVHGHRDLGLRPEEAASIARFEDVREALRNGDTPEPAETSDPTRGEPAPETPAPADAAPREPLPGEADSTDWRAVRDAEIGATHGETPDEPNEGIRPTDAGTQGAGDVQAPGHDEEAPQAQGQDVAPEAPAADTAPAPAEAAKPDLPEPAIRPVKAPVMADDGMASTPRPTDETNKDKLAGLLQRGLITQQEHQMLAHIQDQGQADGTRQSPEAFNDTVNQFLADKEAYKARKGDQAAARQVADLPDNIKAQAMAAIRAYLDRAGLHDTGVKLTDHLSDLGRFHPDHNMIELATNQSPDDFIGSLHHEALHALRNAGVFNDREWSTLVDAAKADPAANAFGERYRADGISEDAINEEKVAELFRQHQAKPQPTTFIGKAIAKVKAIGNAIARAFGKSGSADDIFRRAASGELAARGRQTEATTGVKARKLTPEVRADDASRKTPADAMDDLGGRVRQVALNFFTMHQLAELNRNTPIGALLKNFADNLNMSVAVKDTFIHQGAQVHDSWRALPADEAAAIGRHLIESTIAANDLRSSPSAEFKALSPPARKVYGDVLDHFTHQRDQFRSIMAEIITKGDGTPAEKKDAIRALNDRLNKPVYFPLMRFGDFTNVGVKGDDRVVTSHETRADQLAAARDMEAAGMTVTKYGKMQYQPHLHAPTTAFTAKFDAILRADTLANPGRAEGNAGLSLMMHSLAGSMAPEGSALRNSLLRKNVAGYSKDAERVFSVASRRNAGFLAALHNGERQRGILAQIDARIKGLQTPDSDTTRLTDVRNQVNKQYNILSRYAKTPIQDFLSNMTYAYMLGGSPSFMAMHLLQTPMVTAPMLSAHFNPARVSGELGKAFAEVTRSIGSLKEGREATFGATPGEKAMIAYAQKNAVISSTHSDQFLSAGDNPGRVAQAGEAVMKAASFLPHYTEKANRVTTLLAAYRMAVTSPKIASMLGDESYHLMLQDSPELAKLHADPAMNRRMVAAMDYANRMTLDSHVDYSRENAPTIFQPGASPLPTKLLFQFQKYQQAMLYQLYARGMDAADKSLSGEERLAALKTLGGVVTTHGILTGAMGLPAYGLVATALNLYHKTLGDKDQAFDADDAFHQFLNRTMGKDVGDMVGRGILYAPGVRDLVPADITDRLGMGDLLASPKGLGTGPTDRDAVATYIGTALGGPAASLLGQFVGAWTEHSQGDDGKAAELLMPKVIRDLTRTARFQAEGVTTSSNNPVVQPGELHLMDLVTQAMGFTPQKVEAAYANRASVQDAKAELDARRKILLKEYVDAATSDDSDKLQAARDRIDRYNQIQRSTGAITEMINGSAMMRAVQNRRLAGLRLSNGVAMSPKERGLVNEYGVQEPST